MLESSIDEQQKTWATYCGADATTALNSSRNLPCTHTQDVGDQTGILVKARKSNEGGCPRRRKTQEWWTQKCAHGIEKKEKGMGEVDRDKSWYLPRERARHNSTKAIQAAFVNIIDTNWPIA